MKVRRRADSIRMQLADGESQLLGSLIDDFTAMLEDASPDDPAVQRLFPDGYTDDETASAEYRDLVEADLKSERSGRLQQCRSELPDGNGTMSLDSDAADRWLRVLNDLRLTLGTRLEVTEDEELDPSDPAATIYYWLGAVQELLVEQVMG